MSERCQYMTAAAGAEEPSWWCRLDAGHDGDHDLDDMEDDARQTALQRIADGLDLPPGILSVPRGPWPPS